MRFVAKALGTAGAAHDPRRDSEIGPDDERLAARVIRLLRSGGKATRPSTIGGRRDPAAKMSDHR